MPPLITCQRPVPPPVSQTLPSGRSCHGQGSVSSGCSTYRSGSTPDRLSTSASSCTSTSPPQQRQRLCGVVHEVSDYGLDPCFGTILGCSQRKVRVHRPVPGGAARFVRDGWPPT